MSPHAPAELLRSAGHELLDPAREHVTLRIITPELALVSPELAELARTHLPERPRRGSAAQVDHREPPRAASARGVRARVQSSALAALAVMLVLGAGLAAVGRNRVRDGDRLGAVSTAVPSRGKISTSPGAGLTPGGGYVVTPRGSLLADATGRAIRVFTLPLACGSEPLVLRHVPVSTPSFEFTGTAGGNAIRVRLEATVLDPGRVRGVVVAESGACSPARVAFEARLS